MVDLDRRDSGRLPRRGRLGRAAVALVIATGMFAPAASADASSARHRDGRLDRSFGDGGVVTTDLGGDIDWGETASALAVQPDGKIVAAGPVLRTAGDQQTSEWTLVRYGRNGTLDPTFGNGGRVTTRFGGGWDYPSSIVVQPDGKIVAAGFAGHIPGGSRSDFGLARYDPDGDLDPSFGTGGLVVTDFGVDETVYDVTLTSNGRIVVAGARDDGFGPNRDIALARWPDLGACQMNGVRAPGRALRILGALTSLVDELDHVSPD